MRQTLDQGSLRASCAQPPQPADSDVTQSTEVKLAACLRYSHKRLYQVLSLSRAHGKLGACCHFTMLCPACHPPVSNIQLVVPHGELHAASATHNKTRASLCYALCLPIRSRLTETCQAQQRCQFSTCAMPFAHRMPSSRCFSRRLRSTRILEARA